MPWVTRRAVHLTTEPDTTFQYRPRLDGGSLGVGVPFGPAEAECRDDASRAPHRHAPHGRMGQPLTRPTRRARDPSNVSDDRKRRHVPPTCICRSAARPPFPAAARCGPSPRRRFTLELVLHARLLHCDARHRVGGTGDTGVAAPEAEPCVELAAPRCGIEVAGFPESWPCRSRGSGSRNLAPLPRVPRGLESRWTFVRQCTRQSGRPRQPPGRHRRVAISHLRVDVVAFASGFASSSTEGSVVERQRRSRRTTSGARRRRFFGRGDVLDLQLRRERRGYYAAERYGFGRANPPSVAESGTSRGYRATTLGGLALAGCLC
jgi:hypothetical protein